LLLILQITYAAVQKNGNAFVRLLRFKIFAPLTLGLKAFALQVFKFLILIFQMTYAAVRKGDNAF
jgi:hypothetical protein